MTVVTPALVPNFAAIIFVLIPPVPRDEPEDETSASKELISVTTSIVRALGSVRGLAV